MAPVHDDLSCYTIAFTLRSGSNVLCDYFTANRIGRPAEYFQYPFGVANRSYYEELGVPPGDFRRFLPRLLAARSAGGLFGAKVTWDHRNALRAALERGFPGCSDVESLGRAHRWIWLRRRDKIAQAVSLWRAVKSRQWTSAGERPSDRPPYDYFRIMVGLYAILTEEYCWEEHFRTADPPPLVVYYEDLVARPAAVVCELARALQPLTGETLVARESDVRLVSPLAVQRDAYSAELAGRVRDDLAHLGVEKHWALRAAELERWTAFFDREGWKG